MGPCGGEGGHDECRYSRGHHSLELQLTFHNHANLLPAKTPQRTVVPLDKVRDLLKEKVDMLNVAEREVWLGKKDLQVAISSVGPGAWLSSTAIHLTLEHCHAAGLRIFNPSFLSSSWAHRKSTFLPSASIIHSIYIHTEDKSTYPTSIGINLLESSVPAFCGTAQVNPERFLLDLEQVVLYL